MGPLSAKQHREYLKFSAQEARETAKMEREEARKQQLHEIKLIEAAGKAGQTLGHKEDVHKFKMGTLGAPLKAKTPNPLAGTELFKRGQHMLPFQVEDAAKARKAAKQNTDTVPAMLTPGEAVIPKPAAQDPKNKPIIKRMVQEGRKANRRGYANGTVNVNVDAGSLENTARELADKYLDNGYRDGSINIANSDVIPSRVQQAAGYNEGTIQVPVPSLAYEHPDVPGSSFKHGTERVPSFSRGSSASYHYEDGTLEVPTEEMYAKVVEQALPSPIVEQPPVPVVAVAPVQNVVAGLDVSQVAPQSRTVAAPLKTKNDLYSDAWVRSNEADPKAGTLSKNPNSSAFGLYQMTDAAWKDAYKISPSLKGEDITKPEVQQAARDAYKQSVANQLKAYRIEPTEEAIAKAWVVGANGYRKILNSDPDAPLSLDPKTIAINPNLQGLTNKQFLERPNPYARTQVAVAKLPLSPRDIAIAKQDLATSTNPRVRAQAEATLKQAQVPPPTRASVLQESQPPSVEINKLPVSEVVPKPSRSASGKLVDMRPRDEVGELLVPVPRTMAEANPPVVIPDNMRNLEVTSPGSRQQTIEEANPPVVIPESMKDLEGPVDVLPEEKNKIISLFTKDNEEAIKNEVEVIDRQPDWVNPEEKKTALVKFIESIYGPTGMFNEKDLTRFAVVAAGGLLTGGSVNGSFKYAARDTLQTADARRAAEAAQASKVDSENRAYRRQKELKEIELGVTNVKERQKETKAYFNKTVDDYEREGRLTPANATLLRKAIYNGNYSAVEKALDDPGTYGTDLFKAGVPQGAKPVTIVEEGYTTGRPAYKDESGNYTVFDTDEKGIKVPRVISSKNQREVGDTTNIQSQNENRFKDNLLASQYFRQDKETGATPFDLSSQEVISQLNVWQQEQRRLGLPDDYTRFSDQINDGLNRALKSGEKKTINTSVLTDENKMTVNNNQLDSKLNGKSIPTSKIGEMVEDVRKHNSPKEKYKNRVDEYKAQSNSSMKFLDKVSTEYEQMKQEEGFTPNALAEKARTKKVDDKLINKIREAPNSYWALMYYRMAVPIKD
jgi:hypothetical protein